MREGEKKLHYKILMVEDEKRMQEIIKDYFEVKECEVFCASDGIEALEKNRWEFTSAIAHKLKTSLGIIRTYGEGLKEKIAEDKKDH